MTNSLSGDLFGMPPNLYIIGTMNTADRSIALLDLALRRRFAFVEIAPDPTLLNTVAGVDLNSMLSRLNERIELLLDRDHRIGHSYLMKIQSESDLHFAWFRRVLPLLQEYFYNDNERLFALLGDGFLEKIEVSSAAREVNELIDTDSPRYQHKILDAAQLALALKQFEVTAQIPSPK